ncbi:MAG: VWA domain-containing protein [Pseudomonadota bacterium]
MGIVRKMWVWSLAPIAGVLAGPLAAQTPAADTDIMIVLDSSGSMWGQIDGTSKRDIARTALRDLLSDLPSGAKRGLIAYGHRKKGDCSDIETLAAPSAGADIAAKADAIRPMGKTPLSAAVRKAAEQLKFTENAATVIAITDGIETCDADPCAAGAELEALGIDFTAHVVGFGLSEAEGRQVACLAEETGGLYLQASDAGTLSDAFKTVAKATTQETPDVGTAEASLIVPETVEIGAKFEVAYEGPEDTTDRPDYIDLVGPEAKGTAIRSMSYFYIRKGNPAILRAPAKPGVYLARYIWVTAAGKQVIAEAFVQVTQADVALSAPDTAGVGTPIEVSWIGPGNENDYIDIVPEGQKGTTSQISYTWVRKSKDNVLVVKAPKNAGAYDLRYVARGADGKRALKTLPITIEEVRTELAFAPEMNLGGVLDVSWTGPGNSNDYIDIVPRGQTNTTEQLTYRWTRNGNPAELKLPGNPGEYDVRYVLSAPDGKRVLASAPLTLNDVEVALDFPASVPMGAPLEVSWTGPGGPNDYVDIVPRGYTKTSGQLAFQWTRKGEVLDMAVPTAPGEYDIRYVLYPPDGKRVLKVMPLTVTPVEVTLDAPATLGQDQVLEVSWTGPSARNDYIDLVPAGTKKTSGQITYQWTRKGEVLTLQLPAKPGTYDLRYVHAGAGKKVVLKSQSVTITDVPATLEAPATGAAGTKIEVLWTGPGTYRDYVDIVPRGQKRTKGEIAYFYTRNAKDGVGLLTLPKTPGEYDIRYIFQGVKARTLKTVRPITVE